MSELQKIPNSNDNRNKASKRKMAWWKLFLCGLGLAGVLIVAIPLLKMLWVLHRMPWLEGNHSTDTVPVHVSWSGKDYWISRNYFFTPLQHVNDKDGANLILLLPDFEPKTKGNIDYIMKVRGYGRKLYISVTPDDKSPLDSLARNRIMDYVYGADCAKVDYKTHWKNGTCHGKRQMVFKGEQYGLQHYYPENFDAHDTMMREIFALEKNGEITTFLNCVPHEMVGVLDKSLSPSCELNIWHDGVWLQARFSADYLPQWQDIHDKIIAMFERFKQPPENQLRGK